MSQPEQPLSRFQIWILASRPKTLPAAAAGVVTGTALALHDGHFRFGPALAALLVALLLQIGSNLANDVYDYERGADAGERHGPMRVTQARFAHAHAGQGWDVGGLWTVGFAGIVSGFCGRLGGNPDRTGGHRFGDCVHRWTLPAWILWVGGFVRFHLLWCSCCCRNVLRAGWLGQRAGLVDVIAHRLVDRGYSRGQ